MPVALKEREKPSSVENLLQSFSLEMIAKDLPKLNEIASKAPSGMRISITFLRNEDFSQRVRAAAAVRRLGFVPVPHISARRLRSQAELRSYLDALKTEANVDSVLVIAGDLPQPEGPYNDALAVIRSGDLTRYGIGHVGIAGHPAGHPDVDGETLSFAMRQKLSELKSQGLDAWITTQFGFDAQPVLEWLRQLRTDGIYVPVRVGLAGPASMRMLLQFAARCGVEVSTKILAKYGLSIGGLLRTAGPDLLVEKLAAELTPNTHGSVQLHFYPFGGLLKTMEWLKQVTASHPASVRGEPSRG